MTELTRSQVKSDPISKPPMFPLMLSLSRDNSIPLFSSFLEDMATARRG